VAPDGPQQTWPFEQSAGPRHPTGAPPSVQSAGAAQTVEAIAVLVAQQSSVPSADFGEHAAGQEPIAVVARPPLPLLLDPAPLLLLDPAPLLLLDPAPLLLLDPAPLLLLDPAPLLLLLLDPAPPLLLDPAPPLLLPPGGGSGALVELHPPVVATATAVPNATPMEAKKTTRPAFFIRGPYRLSNASGMSF
jgi:hypothetical protein